MSNPPFKSTFASGCQPPVTVTIDGVEVPVVEEGVRTVIRKNGMLSPTRRSEVTIPLRWGDSIPATAANALMGGPDQQQHVHIKLRDPPEEPSTSAYATCHHGWIRSAGPGPKDGTGRLIVGSFSEYLEKIPASTTFGSGATVADVLAYVRRAFIDGCPIVDDLEVIGVDSSAPLIDPIAEVQEYVRGLSTDAVLRGLFGKGAAPIIDAVIEEDDEEEVIPEFDPHNWTNRSRLTVIRSWTC